MLICAVEIMNVTLNIIRVKPSTPPVRERPGSLRRLEEKDPGNENTLRILKTLFSKFLL